MQRLLTDVQVPRVLPRNRELVPRVYQHLYPLHYVLIDHVLVLSHQLRFKLHFVYYPHLFQEC